MGFGDLAKGGWHPSKDSAASRGVSARKDFKGVNQLAGWMGKGKTAETEDPRKHHSAPLSTLKDPASFGPPPRHIARADPKPVDLPVRSYATTGLAANPESETLKTAVAGGGWGSPLTRDALVVQGTSQTTPQSVARPPPLPSRSQGPTIAVAMPNNPPPAYEELQAAAAKKPPPPPPPKKKAPPPVPLSSKPRQ